jgi:hypothetical protein
MNTLKLRPRSSFRPRLESLEDRVQPSSVPVGAMMPALLGPAMTPSAVDITSGTSGINPSLTVTADTYVTQSANAVQGLAVTLDAAGDQFVGGVVTNGSGAAVLGFVAKYLPGGTTLDASFGTAGIVAWNYNSGTDPSDVRGIAVLSNGTIDVVGALVDPAANSPYFQQLDSTGAFLGNATTLYFQAPNLNPNFFTGIAVDTSGNAYLTGVGSGTTFAPHGAADIAEFDSSGNFIGGIGFYPGGGYDRATSNGVAFGVDSTGTPYALIGGNASPNSAGFADGMSAFITAPIVFNVSTIGIDIETPNDINPGAPPGNVTYTGAAVPLGSAAVGFFSGTMDDPSGTGTDGFVAQIDVPNGTILGTPFVLHDGTSSFSGIALGASGNVYVIGTDVNPTTGLNNAVVYQLDSGLNQLAFAMVGSPDGGSSGIGTETGRAIALDANENVYGVGTSTSDDASSDGTVLNGPSDAWLFHLSNP